VDVIASIIFPFNGSVIRQPLGSGGSRRFGSPPSSLLRAAPTSGRSSRGPSFPSVGGTALCQMFAPFGSGTPLRAWVRLTWFPSPLVLSAETAGSPRFLENPCARALLYDPGGALRSGHYDLRVLSSARRTSSTPTARCFRGSITRPRHSLSTLRRVGHPSPRKTRFRLLASFAGRGLLPPRWVPLQGFRLSMSSILLAQAWPGALPVHHCSSPAEPSSGVPTDLPPGQLRESKDPDPKVGDDPCGGDRGCGTGSEGRPVASLQVLPAQVCRG